MRKRSNVQRREVALYPVALRDEIFTVKVNYNQRYHAVCTWSSCSPARDCTAGVGEEGESEKGRVETFRVSLQLTRPTVLLNEIIAFGWHLFTNSCTQNLLAQRASGESVFGCPTENLLVQGNRTGGNFEPCG